MNCSKSPVPVLMMVRALGLGGIERDVSKLARHMDRSRFLPHVASFLPFGPRFREITAAGIPVLHLPLASLYSPSALSSALRLLDYLRENRIQIVHTFDWTSDIYGIPLARLARIPVSIASQLWVHPVNPPRIARLLGYSYRLATAIYVNCHAVKRQLVEEKGIQAERVFVCHNGVETDVFFPPKTRRGLDPSDAPIVIGTIAVMRPEKSLPTLVEAFAKVVSQHPLVRLKIAGSGPERAELESRIRRLGIGDACELLAPPENVAERMRSIDIFVSCSLTEAFSNAILEAMACGCCPVGTNVGGTPELIKDGERGFLCRPGDADDLAARLCTLIEKPELIGRFGAAASGFARESLSIRIAADRLADEYASLLDRA